MDYKVAITAVKHSYFSTVITSTNSYPAALFFKVAYSLLGSSMSQSHLYIHCKEYSRHLKHKSTQSWIPPGKSVMWLPGLV